MLRPREIRATAGHVLQRVHCQWSVREYSQRPVNKRKMDRATKLTYAERAAPSVYAELVDEDDRSVRVVSHSDAPTASGRGLRLSASTEAGKAGGPQMLVMRPGLAESANESLKYFYPQLVRERTARYYVGLQGNGGHGASEEAIDVDVHVAGVFLQNFASLSAALKETRRRMGEGWAPRRVLDVGFGPATGMVALNEIMGEEWQPEKKTAVVIGHPYMAKRAEVLLGSQWHETGIKPEEKPEAKPEAEVNSESEQPKTLEETLEETQTTETTETTEPTKPTTKTEPPKPTIKTTITQQVPLNASGRMAEQKKYDLIMSTHQLNGGTGDFNRKVEKRTTQLLDLLAPGGVLILVERGNPLGFESIARARQVMLRPESGGDGNWHGAAHLSPVDVVFVEDNDAGPSEGRAGTKLSEEEIAEFGLPKELLEAYDVEGDYDDRARVSREGFFKLRVLGPCTHHAECPLQLGAESREKDRAGRFGWCKFGQVVQRAKFVRELKKGQYLAARWTSADSGRAKDGRGLAGKGRPYGKSHETAVFSYLSVVREDVGASSSNSTTNTGADTTSNINSGADTETNTKNTTNTGADTTDITPTPDPARILRQPLKRDGHVVMEVCSEGRIGQWTVPRSFGKQAYHDARKADGGDLWRLGAKTRVTRETNAEKLERFLKGKKQAQKEQEEEEDEQEEKNDSYSVAWRTKKEKKKQVRKAVKEERRRTRERGVELEEWM